MTKRTKRNHTPAFKAKMALAAVKGDKTLAELAQQFGVQLTERKTHARDQPLHQRPAHDAAGEAPSAGRLHVGTLGAIKSECLGDFVGILGGSGRSLELGAAFVEIRGEPPRRGNKMRGAILKYALITLHSVVVITGLAACSSYTPAERAQLQKFQEEMGREPFGE